MCKKPIMITHTDLDGVGCAVIFKYAFGADADVRFVGNHVLVDREINAAIAEDPGMLIISDLSPSSGSIANINNNAFKNGIRVIDHHATALHLNHYDWANIDVNRCGTMGVYDELLPHLEGEIGIPHVYPFCSLVDDYDRWIHSTPDSKRLNTLFFIMGRDAFIDRCLGTARPHKFNETDELLISIATKEEKSHVDRAIQSALNNGMVDMFGHKALFVFSDKYQSAIGEQCRVNKIDADFVAIFNAGSGTVSLRSIGDDIDVAEIAKLMGGGGHPKSAGYNVGNEFIIDIVSKMKGGDSNGI